LGHLDGDISVTEFDKKEDEWRADDYAITTMLAGVNNDIEKSNYGVGMLIGFSSLLLLRSQLHSRTHPDTHERIEALVRRLELEERHNLWGIACLTFMLWDKYYKKNLAWSKEAAHYKEWYGKLISTLKSSS
jgi:hypothetical protein